MRRKPSYQSIGVRLIALLAACCGMGVTQASAEPDSYTVYALDSLGGTSSRGNGINNQGLATGYSNLAGNTSRHAVAWLRGRYERPRDAGRPQQQRGLRGQG